VQYVGQLQPKMSHIEGFLELRAALLEHVASTVVAVISFGDILTMYSGK